MINKIIAFLQEPYPQNDDNKEIVKNGLIIAVIVTFVLAIFKPFGFSEVNQATATKYALIFGAMALVVFVSYELCLKYILKLNRDHPDWTFWKWLLTNLILCVCVAIANYFFTVNSYGLPHSLKHFSSVLLSTLSVGLFPFILFGSLIVIRQSHRNEKVAAEIQLSPENETPNDPVQLVRLPIYQSDHFFEIDAHEIICIEAMQNYIQIHYYKENELIKKLIRNTISSIEQAVADTSIRRSHRSFLVNTAKIEKVTGNAQGLKLDLNPSPGFWVPVSRKYIPIFRNKG